jgi:hypothetical protein
MREGVRGAGPFALGTGFTGGLSIPNVAATASRQGDRMTAPSRPPSFFNSLTGRDVDFPASLREPGFLIDDLAGDVRNWPNWLVDDDSQRRISLSLIEHVTEQRVVIGFVVDGAQGTVTATPDPSGYLRVLVAFEGADYLTLFVERIWEEYELWPPGAAAAIGDEAPGHMGKHRSWVSISASGWPVLAEIANSHGWLNVRQLE